MWQPDGWGSRARIGVLTPDADVVPESEFQAMAPEGVSIHAARVSSRSILAGKELNEAIELATVRAFAEPPFVDNAAELLAAAPLNVIAYAFTSSSYLGDSDHDAALTARLQGRTRGIPVVTTSAAAVLALRVLGARRLALIHPPWFSPELNHKGAEYFGRQQIDVVYASPAGLPGGQHDVHPGQLYEWARAHVPVTADAVFVGGNGFRAIGAIQALEEDLGRSVLTANQVLFWHALRLTGVRTPVVGYGQVFARGLPS